MMGRIKRVVAFSSLAALMLVANLALFDGTASAAGTISVTSPSVQFIGNIVRVSAQGETFFLLYNFDSPAGGNVNAIGATAPLTGDQVTLPNGTALMVGVPVTIQDRYAFSGFLSPGVYIVRLAPTDRPIPVYGMNAPGNTVLNVVYTPVPKFIMRLGAG